MRAFTRRRLTRLCGTFYLKAPLPEPVLSYFSIVIYFLVFCIFFDLITLLSLKEEKFAFW